MESENVWTTNTNNNNNNGINDNLSRIPTAPINNRVTQNYNNNINKNSNNHNNNNGSPYIIGVQSRFRRKYFHKVLFIILIILIIILLIALIILAICYKDSKHSCVSKECIRSAANLVQSMDRNIDPCEDFYRFTCGNWAEDHPRPESSTSYDWFSEKQTKILRTIRKFLQSNGTEMEPDAVAQSRIMYKACMDTDTMNTLGLKPVQNYLEQFLLPNYPTILNVTNVNYTNYKFEWINSIAMIKKWFGADYLIGFDILPDPSNRTINRLVFGTPETGTDLPFKNDFERKLKIMQKNNLINENSTMDDDIDFDNNPAIMAYKLYITEIISALLFYTDPSVNMELILPNIQQAANITMKLTKLIYQIVEEAENSTNKQNPLDDMIYLNIDELQNESDRLLIAPQTIPVWKQYLRQLFDGIPEAMLNVNDALILTSKPDVMYLANVIELISKTPLIEIELYIWWNIVEELILHTTSDIRDLHSDYAKTITHLETSTPRSIYCTGGVNQMMGMAVSYAIAKPNFYHDIRPKVITMLENIREAFNRLVRQTNWMDEQTKLSTLEKSDAMKSLIGFPEWILDDGELDEFYENIKLNETTHLKNMMDILKWHMITKLKSYRLTEMFGWATTPTHVNAFHTFQANAITIPLAILQYPFYNHGIEALNYGAIGSILGHELTHGFDDSGRMFDKNGNMRQWWSNRTIVEYINRTSCFVKQYSNYYLPEVSDYVNGELTLGENIADNGGLREAYYAYKIYVNNFGTEPKLPGFENYTSEQLFFISFGNLWCETQTYTSTKWALEDSHCPGRIRLKGVLSNSPEFTNTFNCKPGSGMYPKEDENRCRIW